MSELERLMKGGKPKEQFIYFICQGEDLIKIGLSQDPEKRLKALQTASSEKLYLRYKLKGDYALENFLHRLFAPYHIQGEWYWFDDVIRQFIQYQFIPKEFCKGKGV